MSPTHPQPLVTVVIVTHNRPAEVERTLTQLCAADHPPPIVVVDNASSDPVAPMIRSRFRGVTAIPLPYNAGAAARTTGARVAATPLVAFSDDDSWWEPGALEAAAALFDEDPRLGLVAGHVLVGEEGTDDPTSLLMAAGARNERFELSPTGRRGVTGFLACGAIVRRRAFIAAGGFNPRLFIGGEEELVALDLADAGWKLVYAPDIVARHFPSPVRDHQQRRHQVAVNRQAVGWLRYPARSALQRSGDTLRSQAGWAANARVAAQLMRSAAWIATNRRVVRTSVVDVFES